MHGHRRAEQDAAEQDEQPSDVRERQAADPGVSRGRLEREGRRGDGPVDGAAVELDELRIAGGPRGGDHEDDALLRGDPVRPALDGRVAAQVRDHDGRPRETQERVGLRLREARVDRHEGRPGRPDVVDEVHPAGAGRERHRHEVALADAARAPERSPHIR